MELHKNGESSRSPQAQGTEPAGIPNGVANSALLLPEWDPLPVKHLHSSLDLISLLHLDGLYNSYVRPYFDPVPETDDEGGATGPGGSAAKPARPRKKQGLSKGYVGLLEDCIDPVPAGNGADQSLIPLVSEWLEPGRPPAQLWDAPLVPLSIDKLASARLESGLKQDGYAGGEKVGVREAEEKRRRKKQARLSQSVAPELPDLAASPSASAPPGGGGVIGTPVAPPQRGQRPFSVRGRGGPPGSGGRPPWPRASAPPGAGGYRPPGTPGTPSQRGPGPRPAGTPSTPLKRASESAAYGPGVKRARAMGHPGSRSASPATGGGDVGVKAVFKRRGDEM